MTSSERQKNDEMPVTITELIDRSKSEEPEELGRLQDGSESVSSFVAVVPRPNYLRSSLSTSGEAPPKPPPRGQKLRSSPLRKDSNPWSSSGSNRKESSPSSFPPFAPRKESSPVTYPLMRNSPVPVRKESSPITYPLLKSPKHFRRNKRMETLDKKSFSLSSISKLPSDTEEGADNLVASCIQYLDENEGMEGPIVNDTKEEEGRVPLINPFFDVQMYVKQEPTEPRKLSSISDIRDNIRASTEELSFKSLPRAFQKKKMSKSVKELMDRAKSSEPEVRGRQDGTESVSSFVVLSPSDNYLKLSSTTMETTSSEGWSENDDYEDKTDTFAKKGFVNKCVTRVKSLVGNNSGTS